VVTTNDTPADGDGPTALTSARQFRRFAYALCLGGAVVQLLLTAYYLGVGHAARPHHLPVGLVAPATVATAITSQVEQGGSFDSASYPSAEALLTAIKAREIYGGLDLTADQPHLYVASAAGPAAATALRAAYTAVVQQRTAERVRAATALGQPVPAATVQALATPPHITDVVPLPPDDRNGASLGFLVQALALGGTIASIGLGRLIPRARRSPKRGIGHLAILISYALGSAAVVLWSMTWFGVGAGADHWAMFGAFSLVSLAITASTAGAVALVGPAGGLLGGVYFTIGTVVSGASILPEFLPTAGRVIGEFLPTGAGVTAVRDGLYFPTADIARPLTILAAYAIIGCLIVLVTNVLPNRSDRTSELDIGVDTLLD